MRPRFAFARALVVLCVLALPTAALGQQEDSARALQRKAMDEDYLALDFAKAQARLATAITRCADQCSVPLRARLHRDLGVVRIAAGDRARGLEEFAIALAIDASVTLDRDVSTKQLEQAFAEAKKLGAEPESEPPPRGDFVHTPAPEQAAGTPLPIYVEHTNKEPVARVLVRYKGGAMSEWKNLELAKAGGSGWQVLIPCADVTPSTMRYYVQGFDPSGDPVALSGDRNHPYRVPIRATSVASPPHLPGSPPPSPCTTPPSTADCPPNFPGCGKEEEPPTESPKKTPKLWIGVFGALDLAFTPAADDVCKLGGDALPLNDSGYYCARGSADYPSRDPATGRAENDAIAQDGVSDRVRKGGAALGNVRVMLSLDYAVSSHLLLGTRVGLVLNGYPGEAAVLDGKRLGVPLHLELRATYVFAPIAEPGFSPYLFGGGGVAPFDANVAVRVSEDKASGSTPAVVDAWYLAGPAFLTAGGGARYAISPRFALMLGLRGNLAFLDAFAVTVGPELGGQLGF